MYYYYADATVATIKAAVVGKRMRIVAARYARKARFGETYKDIYYRKPDMDFLDRSAVQKCQVQKDAPIAMAQRLFVLCIKRRLRGIHLPIPAPYDETVGKILSFVIGGVFCCCG
jgi:hypothetical protein